MVNGELHHLYSIREVNCSHSGSWSLAGIDKNTRLRIGPAFVIDGKPGEATGEKEINTQNAQINQNLIFEDYLTRLNRTWHQSVNPFLCMVFHFPIKNIFKLLINYNIIAEHSVL